MLFKELADGETNVADAFNVADVHAEVKNFWSAYMPTFKNDLPPANATLDDNGDKVGSTYDLPYNGSWHDVGWLNVFNEDIFNEGPFANQRWVQKRFKNFKKYFVSKARVRFYVRSGIWQQVTAKLYEFNFHSEDGSWILPTGYNDPYNVWDNEIYAYDINTNTKASCTKTNSEWVWTERLELTLSKRIKCDKIRFYAWYCPFYCKKIDVEIYYSDGYLAANTGL
jgi:hypothetical protein